MPFPMCENVSANATQINIEGIKMLLGLLHKFDELFDVTLREWGT